VISAVWRSARSRILLPVTGCPLTARTFTIRRTTMRISSIALLVAASPLIAVAGAQSANTAPPPLKWGPAPAVFPAGAELAVLQGNPGGTGEFTIRLRMPNGYKIAPHTHPTDENVTVISGTFLVGMGTTFKADSLIKLPTGGFVTAQANHAHYGQAKGVTIVQVNAMGPFALTYVNPADTPKAARQ
jgi:quercetin dioxygenase-like cupin family protein